MNTVYDVQARVETITENTRLTDKKYGGWKAINIGTAPVTVCGIELLPTEGLDFTNAVDPGSFWVSPIDITVQLGGAVRLIRFLYKKHA